jgi:dTDP-4-dehydrorhamnose reductase
MRILITGASGLLGKSLIETIPDGHVLSATYNKNWQNHSKNVAWYHLNTRNRSSVFDIFDLIKPNVVIHCASIGSVDYSEDHYKETRAVNVGGLGHVIDAANGYKSRLIYVSTNAVYSGKQPLYNEKSPLEPVNAYGVIKREAEHLVRLLANKWIIIRPFMLYGWPYRGGRTNWAVRIAEGLKDNEKSLNLVDDITWMPTYAPDCAEAIWKLLFQKEIDHEVFNVASPERATLYQFGLKVCEVFGLEKNLLKPVKSEYFSAGRGAVKAKRPADTSYDLIKLSEHGIMLSDIKSGLEKMKAEARE